MRRGKYGIVVSGLLLLIAGAFFLPDIIWKLQDCKRLDEYQFQARESIDYNVISTDYNMDRYSRLSDFAKGCSEGRKYYVASSEDVDVDVRELLRNVFSGPTFWEFTYMGKVYYKKDDKFEFEWDLMEKAEVEKQKYFVIYDGDSSSGAAFLCQYMELRLPEDRKIILLVDARDYSVYYMKVCYSGDEYIYAGWKDIQEELYGYGYNDLYFYMQDYCSAYYGARMPQELFFAEETAEGYFPADEKAGLNKAGLNENTEDSSARGIYTEYYDVDGSVRAAGLEMNYEGGMLEYLFSLEREEENLVSISMGIREIMDILPID